MKHTIRLIIAAFAVWCWCVSSAFAQQSQPYNPSVFIKIDINSGDPAFPYPQFKEYKVGKTLAKYNAEGVTHADMEKTGREAYEIMSHRCRYSKTSQGGVRYISFNDKSVPASTHAPHCSEGDGYMLLMSAIFADQPTFNGLWMWIHDYKIPKVERYYDGQVFLPNYKFSPGLPLCYTDETNIDAEEGSATDGDDDIALAVLIAYKQWGEWMMQDGKQVLDSKGRPISYKKIAQDFLAAYVDTFMITSVNGDGSIYKGGHTSGDIGIDGYVHGGNKGGDMTQWRQTQTDYPFVTPNCNLSTPDAYADYVAPAYYNEFAKFLEEDGNGTDWQINQYKRGEASSDWLIGQAYKQGMIASAGKFSFAYGNDANVSFTQFSEGEDFRFVLRTILNYMWHGNPETTWDPVAHQPKAGGNTFEKDMADRMADFLKKPWSGYGNKAPGDSHGQCVQMGSSPDPGQPYWSGVCNIMQSYNGDKTPMGSGASPAPYTLGASAAAAVCSGDLDLIADMYRQSEITWDGTNKAVTWDSEERYIGNTPEYFHGFYRCWGLLTHTGNLHAPQDMKREANVKVYMSVDKTYAYVDDEIEYHVQFRNYGSAEATGVKIETELDSNYEVVAIKRGNGTVSGNKIIWNVGSIPGFKTGGLAATMDSVSFVVVVKDTLNPRICLTSTISGSNFEDWTSNEYPNHATYTMERNCVDIVPDRTLQLKKKASRKLLNPNDAVTFTLEFENKSLGEASWLNGGRDNVRLSYANYISGTEMFQGYRFWHDAYEAYINPGNYRVSYFMYDAAAMGLYSNQNPTGWDFTLNNYNDCYKYLLTETPDTISFHYQRIPSGEDEHGKWNQRLMVQFADYTMAPSSYTFNKIADRQGTGANNFYSLHKGVSGPSFIRTQLRSNPHLAMDGKVKDDWSYKKLQTKDRPMDMQTSALYLLTPCYADVNNLGYPVDIHARNVCYTGDIDMTTYDRMLVEEFDGYTWRRILGRAPLPGRECMNVQVVDTIPYELEFHHWVDSTALKNDKGEKIKATYTPAPAGTKAYSGIIKWSVPSMLVGEKDKLVYVCVARNMGCPDVDDVYYSNVAWISSETDSPDSSRVDLVTTCREIPPVGEEQESLFKSADKKAAQQGETVTYEVKYINNTGTHVEANCKSTDGWKALGGSSLPKVDGGHLLLNTEGSYLFAPEYSYGNNGDVYLQLDNCTDAITNTWVVLRWTAGTPGSSNFKGAAVKLTPHASLDNTFKCEVYDNGTCIAKEGEGDDLIIYPGNARNPEFKFTFVDDHLFMYINNADEEWVDVMKDWKGMSAKGPGYFGMFVNGKTNSGPHLTKFETDLDYAFNVTLYDQLPEELGNITSISDNGSWNEPKNFITWPTVATTVETAIPPMETVVRTYTAEVVACVDKYITNMGLATVYGLDTLKVLNTIECGSEECELIRADAVLDQKSICEGDSTLLHGYGDDGKDGSRFLYEFFLNNVSLGKASYTGKIYVKEAGSYHVVVTSPVDPTCFLESDKVELMLNERPVGQNYNWTPICKGSSIDDNEQYLQLMSDIDNRPSDITYTWTDEQGGVPAIHPNITTDVVGDFEKRYVLVSDNGCVSDTMTLFYSVVDAPEVPLGDSMMCPKTSLVLDASSMGKSYKWSTNETTQSITVTAPGTYTVIVTTDDGCEVKGQSIVTELDTINLSLTDVTICAGQTGTLDAGSEGVSYLWSDGSTSQTLTTDVAGTYTVTVTSAEGCKSHASASITVADQLVVDLGPDTTICASKLPYILDATSNYDSFDWSDGTSSQTMSVTASGVYLVKVTQGTCSGEGKVTVTVSEVADPVVDHPISYMVSDTTASGVFDKSLTAQDGTAITYETGATLKWYDEQKNELNSEPVPAVPAGGGNATYTYYVSAVNADGCESGLILVTVTVSGAPTPKVQDVNYCLNDPTVTALTAETTPGQDATESWTLRWYDASGTALNGAPTPGVTTAGTTTYYVSQVSDVTGAESGKVPVKVNVYGVAKPDVSGNRLQYCAGEPYETVTAVSQSDATKYLMGDGTFVWTVDGTEVSDPSVSAQKESISYTVKETYTISAGHVCESEAAEFTVKTTFVPEVTGDLTVNYLMKEGDNGTFPALDVKNPNVAKSETGFSLVWYETDGKTTSQTAPSPKKDPSWTAGGEQELRYYVMQTDGTCSSDTVTIIVKISDSPMPNTTPVEYCQNATAAALTATINDDMESADQYTLVWYDVTTGDELTDAPVPSTQTAGETTYYVAQRHKTTGATSAKSNIKVTVRALPVLMTQDVPAQCGGTVILSNYIKEANGLVVSQNFYSDASATTQSAEIVTASGTYYSDAYFTLTNGEKCYSEVKSVDVTINDLSDLTVTGPTTVCPGGTVTLTATATSQDPGVVSYSWEGGVSGTSGEYTTPAMTGSYGQQFTYTVKASAGACVETLSQTHTVTIDRGVLTGAMTMNGETSKRYKTCGDETITIETSHSGSDYSWKTLDGQTVPGTTSISVTPTMTTTYVVTLTNVCETSDTVTVEVHPLSAKADWTGLNKTVCEGDAFKASLTLTGYDATQNGSYIRWYKGGEELTAYANQTTLSVTSATADDAGIYSYKVSNGVCEVPETEDSGELVVVTPATYTQSEGVVSCSGEAVEISVTVNETDATLLWSDDAMANATRMVAPTENTEYEFMITRSDVCVTKGSVRVAVRKNPSVSIEDVTLCEGSSQTLKATVEGDELTSYSWTDAEGNELGSTETLTVTPEEDARYTLTVTSASCGDASATAKVTVIELPRLLIDSVGLRSREFQVENLTSSAYEYKVDKSDWQTSGLFENLIYDLLHTAYVRDDYGCEGSLMFIVKAPDYELEPYVTPDDDGVKDKWSVATLLEIYPNANVIIYDRYGKQLVELKGSDTEWDGTYNGHPLPSTDYWYTVNIPEIDQNYNGHFTLIRNNR